MTLKIPEHIQRLKKYSPVLQSAWQTYQKEYVLKLDWNESTDDIYAPLISEYFASNISKSIFNWYPPIIDEELIGLISKYTGEKKEFIKYFIGSDKALEYIVRAFCEKDDDVTIVTPTYDNFRIYVESICCRVNFITPKNIFAEDDLLGDLITQHSKLVYLANPNNPTGWLYSKKEIIKLLNRFPHTLFVIDEAYIEFCHDNTCLSLVGDYSNIIVTRTLSKAWGLASIRFGYSVAHPHINDILQKIINVKEIPLLTLEIAKIALKHPDVMNKYVSDVNVSKEFINNNFYNLKLFDKTELTPANFILVKFKKEIRHKILNYLISNNVYIRDLSHLAEMVGYDRITIGSLGNTKKLYEILRNFKF